MTAERSSGASETSAVDQLAKALVEADPIQLDVELIQRAADRTKAAATICTRMIYPTTELVRWLQRDVEIPVGLLHIDASVAIAVVTSGESKYLEYLRKTQRADLIFLQGIVRHLELTPSKIELNLADLWTKAITGAVLETLLEIAGRRAGLYHRLEKKD